MRLFREQLLCLKLLAQRLDLLIFLHELSLLLRECLALQLQLPCQLLNLAITAGNLTLLAAKLYLPLINFAACAFELGVATGTLPQCV